MINCFRKERFLILLFSLLVIFFVLGRTVGAASPAEFTFPKINIEIGESSETQSLGIALQILLLLTVLSLAPAFIIMVTSFTRIMVVFSLLRHALATQQIPPNQILIGLALFLTFFVMAPTWEVIRKEALEPYLEGRITQEEAWQKGIEPLQAFMLRQTRKNDLALFVNLSRMEKPARPEDVPIHILIPAFIISELKTAFQIGFVLYIPFLVIDIVISSVIMSLGMFMLPPVMISFPFKILLFVLVDGWNLVVQSMVSSFR